MKKILNQLFEYKTLSHTQARDLLLEIAQGAYNHSQLAAFMTVYLMRSITVEELEGFRDAMLELCLHVDLSDYETIDLCGTGGDGKNTFNISTLSAFVVAAAGYKVAKHGNNSVSSACGSSNVLQYLGYHFTNDVEKLRRQIEKHNICFMHAPLFHPAMKQVAPVRQELGIKTFFNMLGPMVNPAMPNRQITGVFSLELARLYAYIFQKTGKSFTIIHALDGYDEISLTSDFKMYANQTERILSPQDLGCITLKPEDLYGGETIEEAAQTFLAVIQHQGTNAQHQAICANAGVAIYCASDQKIPILDAVALADELLQSGKAYTCLKNVLEYQY